VSAIVEMMAEAEEVVVAAGASQRRIRLRPGRCQACPRDLSSTDMRSCLAGSCVIPDVIANAREDAALPTTENT